MGVGRWPKRRIVLAGVAYGICPVWSGLILTDALAPSGQALFALTPTTVILSLVGHLIYGTVLGFGCWQTRTLHKLCPVRIDYPKKT